ncbi:MAG TPA: PAS domain-containing sensor histidine kinase [Myxococcota bacterium]|nr:PAS domain-containing sensor histidine kinase [Myxococcota bacterium]HRY92067.1 PAS domain-containing sensor histidine kinase [Myxococcota bacterium]HSA22330.1 PAS domain-containing sensor histidine kinase [Myxococcota bacterium]
MEHVLPQGPAVGLMLSQVHEGLFVVDARPALAYINDYGARVLGYADAAELLASGASMSAFFTAPEEMQALVRNTREQGTVPGAEFQVRRRDGASLWLEVSAHTVRDPAGAVTGFWGVFRDLTARREAELARDRLHAELVEAHRRLESTGRALRESNAALQKRNRHLREFTAAVTHDLRAPLTTLKGFAEMLQADHAAALGEQGGRLVARIRAGAEQMALVMRGLQELVLLGEESERRVEVDLAQVMRQVLEGRRADLEACGARVEVAPELPRALAHPVKLFLLLDNLLSNALKHHGGPGAPRVSLGWRREGGGVSYCLEDDGRGVSEADRERVFELGFRADRDRPGAGIGLVIARRVVELYGGRIWVERASSGGARFCFQLSDVPPAVV